MMPLLDVQNLQRRFLLRKSRAGNSYLHAVDGVSFAVNKGEAVALVGESGCGKSTLARLVARLHDAESGHILLDGEDLSAIPARRFVHDPRRRRIQMVFQDAGDSLDPRFTARQAIAEPVGGLVGGSRATIQARVEQVAQRVGLTPDLLERRPHQLSGGQRARVGIARALGPQPELLILDEPTAALDVSVQALILRQFDQLRQELDLALLFISHDLNVVRLLCSRVMVMYLGKVVEAGPAEAVFAAPAHPYAQALVRAIPDPARRGARGKDGLLDGEVPSAIDPSPSACRFTARCPVAGPRCRTEAPLLRPSGNGRVVACHLPNTGGAQVAA